MKIQKQKHMKRYNNLLEDELPMQVKSLKKGNWFLFILSLILSVGFLVMLNHELSEPEHICPVQDTIELSEKTIEQHIGEAILYPNSDINDSILYDYIVEIKAWYPDILLAQAKIESGSYSSTVFKKANNLYGMKQVNSRFHCQTSSFNSYGGYDSWKLSVLDRVLWDMFIFDSIKPEREVYLRALRNYAESETYVQAIQKVINSNNISNEENKNKQTTSD